MPSSFVTHHIRGLTLEPFRDSRPAEGSATASTDSIKREKEGLRGILASSKSPFDRAQLNDAVGTLQTLGEQPRTGALTTAAAADEESEQLKLAVLGKLVVSLYSESLDVFLKEASEAEGEADWWADVERSRTNVAAYLIQTLPGRFTNFARTIFQRLRAQGIRFQPSLLTPSSLRRLFSNPSTLRPNVLVVSLFPHLRARPEAFSLSLRVDPSASFGPPSVTSSRSSLAVAAKATTTTLSTWFRALCAFITLPLELTYQECHYKRKELEKIRNERAEVLGALASMRDQLSSALDSGSSGHDPGLGLLFGFLQTLQSTTGQTEGAIKSGDELLPSIQTYLQSTLQAHTEMHASYLRQHELHRPSRLIRIWPRLLLIPPLTIYTVLKISESRATIEEVAKESRETLTAFVKDWLYEPVKDVISTVRAGGDEGMIVSKEGVAADVDSLERMSLALAKEKMNYSAEQLDALSRDIRTGDLTAVLRIYEEDIKSPVKSAVTGTLLRTLFIQIQKAKVDIDQALAGIDKLLKSQELTFAFVGVAPAFALVYFAGSYLKVLVWSRSGKARYGGKKRRAGVWLAMRRIERLLISQPTLDKRTGNLQTNDTRSARSGEIPALTAGLMLLSIARLRTYAETCLPPRSRIREGFLEDVDDLENPGFGAVEKLRIVDRMWKSWGGALEWTAVSGATR